MDAPDRHGVLTAQPEGGHELVFRRAWARPVEDVWSALTEPERLARWIGTYDGARTAGGSGTFTMTQEDEPVGEAMTVLECERPHRLVVDWTGEEHWRVSLDLSKQAGSTQLVFRQVFRAEEAPTDVATGWHWYLDKLEAEVTGGPPPTDWDAFLAEVGPAYGRTGDAGTGG